MALRVAGAAEGREWMPQLGLRLPAPDPPAEAVDEAGHQTSESGIDALRLAMNSCSASSTPSSIGGASYSVSIRFQILLARWAASSEPSSCHCSKLLLSAISL